jgi:hypothetical protein
MRYGSPMRSSIPFDTHAYVKRLEAAGVPEPQAEVHAEALAELVVTHLATKQDLTDMEARMDSRFKEVNSRFNELEARMDSRCKELELRLTLRFGAMLAASIAIVVALLAALNGTGGSPFIDALGQPPLS